MTETPDWVFEGRIVEMENEDTAADDLERVCPDAPFILEPEEYDLEWRIARMPLEGVMNDFADMDDFVRKVAHWSEEEERERVDSLRQAIREAESPDAFGYTYPGIALWDENEGVKFLDGFHRAAVRWFDLRLTDMPVAVGVTPTPKPKP